jgi:hypothetical protein
VLAALADMIAKEYDGVNNGRHSGRPFISVDTFYGSVAEAAAAAGADVINDVSGGTIDPHMHACVAKLDRPLPYIGMHMRGDPGTMQSDEHVRYIDVINDVAGETVKNANKAIHAGIEPWRLWTDPGLGFAKTSDGNWELLRGLRDVREGLGGALARAPVLVGASRKGFLGAVTGRAAAGDRDVGERGGGGGGGGGGRGRGSCARRSGHGGRGAGRRRGVARSAGGLVTMREFDDLPQLMTLLQAQSTLLRYFRHFRLSRVVSASVGALRTAPRFNSHRLRIRLATSLSPRP